MHAGEAEFPDQRARRGADHVAAAAAGEGHAGEGEGVTGPDVGEGLFESDSFGAFGCEDGGAVGGQEGLRAVDGCGCGGFRLLAVLWLVSVLNDDLACGDSWRDGCGSLN